MRVLSLFLSLCAKLEDPLSRAQLTASNYTNGAAFTILLFASSSLLLLLLLLLVLFVGVVCAVRALVLVLLKLIRVFDKTLKGASYSQLCGL